MGRSEQKAKERKAAQQRSLTPYVAPKDVPTQQGKDLRRGGGVRGREAFVIPEFLLPSPITTPVRGERPAPSKVKDKGKNSDDPAKPANTDKPLPYGSLPGGDNPDRSAAQPGAGPKDNTVGSDADTITPGLQGPSSSKPGERVNENKITQYGKTLGGLNAFTKAFTGGYEVADIKTAFQSEDLPGQYEKGSNTINTNTPYELPEGSAPSPLNKGLAGTKDLQISDTAYTVGEASVPGTLGRSGDAQEGTSDKPDIAESVRTIRMDRRNSGRGSRRDPRNRGEDADMFGGPEPSDASLVSPMYANEKRNKIREAFFAGETSVKGAVAANAVAGFGKDSNADPVFNVGGELVYAKDGMKQKAKNAAMMGQDPSEFLAIGGDVPTETQLQSGLKPGSITAPENNGGSLEVPTPITRPSATKQKEAEDFLNENISMLTRKTR